MNNSFLDTWHKKPVHSYYKNEEWKAVFNIDGKMHELFISFSNGSWSLIGSRYILQDVTLEEIENYVSGLNRI